MRCITTQSNSTFSIVPWSWNPLAQPVVPTPRALRNCVQYGTEAIIEQFRYSLHILENLGAVLGRLVGISILGHPGHDYHEFLVARFGIFVSRMY